MKLIKFLIIPLFLFHNGYEGLFAQENTQQQIKRPNILFLFIDDLRADLGVYGNEIIQTPNLDKLARSGYLFNNQYANIPTCGASRYALLTGQLPRSRKHLNNNIIAEDISTRQKTDLPETFIDNLRRNGYKTIGIGKISHSADGYLYPYTAQKSDVLELPHSWDEMLFNPGKWATGWNAFFAQADGSSRISLQGNTKPYEKEDVDDLSYPDGLTTQLAIHKIKELAQQADPFFLGVGLFKPHLPFNAPQKYWDMYDGDKIPISKSSERPKNVNRQSLTQSEEFNQYLLGEEHPTLDSPVSTAYAQKLKHAYYASVSYIDAMIGQIVNTLEQEGLDKNTIIIVWGDHGWQLGDHRIWGKHTLYDISLKSAYIMKLPSVERNGHVIDEVISSVDFYPTLMELCAIPMPSIRYDGSSYAQLIKKGKDKNWKNHAFGYFNNGITLKTPRYRITKYYNNYEPQIELYDHKKDPHEIQNIASEHPSLVKKLLQELEKGNTGLYK